MIAPFRIRWLCEIHTRCDLNRPFKAAKYWMAAASFDLPDLSPTRGLLLFEVIAPPYHHRSGENRPAASSIT